MCNIYLHEFTESTRPIEISFGPETSYNKRPMCSICLSEIECPAQIVELPCSHKCHVACLYEWLIEKQDSECTCPLCRKPLQCIPKEDMDHSQLPPLRLSSYSLRETDDAFFLRLRGESIPLELLPLHLKA